MIEIVMRALRDYQLAGRLRTKGEIFSIRPAYARVLRAAGLAEDVVATQAAPAEPQPTTRRLTRRLPQQ